MLGTRRHWSIGTPSVFL
uniref:Uncharacterized protein n=1 Tax=Arundo donax TaxID=35708 RepID=A0A0A9G867_ARUDO